MIVGPLIKNAPVIGSCYGFATTAVKVYNSSTFSGAIFNPMFFTYILNYFQ